MIASPSRQESLALAIVMPIVTAAVISMRFLTRRHTRLPLLADDWLTIPAWFFTTGVCATDIYSAVNNVLTVENEPPGSGPLDRGQRDFAAVTAVIPILWILAATCIKLSIIYLYRRLFLGRLVKLATNILIAVTLLWAVFSVISWLLFCGTHIRANFEGGWDVCPNWGWHLQLAVYTWDTVIDFLLLVLPIPLLLPIKIKTRRKIGLIVIFMLGSFAFAASLLNAVLTILELNSDLFEGTQSTPDSIFFYWQTLEVGVALLLCNLPSLGPLLNTVFRTKSTGDSRRAYTHTQTRSRKGSTMDDTLAAQESRHLHRDIAKETEPLTTHGSRPWTGTATTYTASSTNDFNSTTGAGRTAESETDIEMHAPIPTYHRGANFDFGFSRSPALAGLNSVQRSVPERAPELALDLELGEQLRLSKLLAPLEHD